MKIAERILDIVENIPLVEMAFERKKIKDKIEGLFKPIIIHLIKLSIFDFNIDTIHWEKEIANYLSEIRKYVRNPKKGADVSNRTAFDLAYTQPLTTLNNDISDNPYVSRIGDISKNYIITSNLINQVKTKNVIMNDIKILDSAVSLSIQKMIDNILYAPGIYIIDEQTEPLKSILNNLITQTSELRKGIDG